MTLTHRSILVHFRGGRAIPLVRASCRKHVYDGHRTSGGRNAFEGSLLLMLKAVLPPQVNLIITADRGFGRT